MDAAGQLAQGLGHEPGLQAHVAVAHVALNFRLRHQGGHAVDHHRVDRAAADQLLGDVQRLLGAVGLGDQQIVQDEAAIAGVDGVQGVLNVDVGCGPAELLSLGHDVDGQGRLSGGLAAEDLGDPASGYAADAQRDVQGQGAGRNALCGQGLAYFAKAHHGAFAVVLLDPAQRDLQGRLLIGRLLVFIFIFTRHPHPSFVLSQASVVRSARAGPTCAAS